MWQHPKKTSRLLKETRELCKLDEFQRVDFYMTNLSFLPIVRIVSGEFNWKLRIHCVYLESLKYSIISRLGQERIINDFDHLRLKSEVFIYGSLEEHNSLMTLKERDQYVKARLSQLREDFTYAAGLTKRIT